MSVAFRSSIKLIIGILIFVGLPLIGWGVKDVQGFIGHPARLGYAVIAILLQVFVVIWLPEVGSRRDKRKKMLPRERLTRQDIADIVGTTVETAIRVMSKFGKQGILTTESKHIVVTSKEKLSRLLLS